MLIPHWKLLATLLWWFSFGYGRYNIMFLWDSIDFGMNNCILCMSTTFMIVNQMTWRVSFCSCFFWKCPSSLVMINGINWCVRGMFWSSIFIICKPSLLEFFLLSNKPFSLQNILLIAPLSKRNFVAYTQALYIKHDKQTNKY